MITMTMITATMIMETSTMAGAMATDGPIIEKLISVGIAGADTITDAVIVTEEVGKFFPSYEHVNISWIPDNSTVTQKTTNYLKWHFIYWFK